MIKAGDIVRVTDWGKAYSRLSDWFKEHLNDLETDWLIKYAYGDQTFYKGCRYNDDRKYKVLYVDEDEGNNACLITRESNYSSGIIFEVYLIHIKGIELYDKTTDKPTEMTIEEIEEKLGIRNLKIIKEDE